MPVVDSFTNSCINMLPDKLSGKTPSCAGQLPFHTGQCPCLTAYFQAWAKHQNFIVIIQF